MENLLSMNMYGHFAELAWQNHMTILCSYEVVDSYQWLQAANSTPTHNMEQLQANAVRPVSQVLS